MTFQPVIPITGYAGWRFLQRTLDTQKDAFVQTTTFQRQTDYFRENISKINTAEELVADRRLLEVALGAFGLDEDIGNKAFIQKILEDGTLAEDALANRLSDKRYNTMSREFGFGDLGSRTRLSNFADQILARFEDRQFERAVGDVNGDMRLALNLSSGLSDIFDQDLPSDAQWFAVMGSTPVRTIFETALGFPSSFGAIDIDQQRTAFQERSQSVFGTDKVEDFADPEMQEKLIRLYLVRSEITAYSNASGSSIALNLLQAMPNLNA
ncbi:DUF1217 domain-containing protein [Flavimaricola marinus]|uniref:Flagellar protein n=1 Tax=Flavimaricola marinus TaxID=1819565 RepID=A0A238LEY6_9RHOB|nr:DUF1217 domain-containing protein [Flavimaricola marinus]SMY08239.1 hypothetical protein LOM8899_02389 [Flavimaricola marinus]